MPDTKTPPVPTDELMETLHLGGASDGTDTWPAVTRALRAIRSHLGMHVAYASEFVGNDSVYRAVDAPGLEALIDVGDSQSLDDVYCRHILEGRLPELIPDTADEPIAAAMPITGAVPIGSHLSVPIKLSSGETYGMFCCLSAEPDRTLGQRDHRMMRAFAELASYEIEKQLELTKTLEAKRQRIRDVLTGPTMEIAYQPIYRLEDKVIDGFESLSRFQTDPYRSPDQWFADAATVGLGADLELEAIRRAFAALPRLPDHPYITVNVAPGTMLTSAFDAVMAGIPGERVVVEITEHTKIENFGTLRPKLRALQKRGFRIAVDDAGTGYAGLHLILALKPDLIKLDRLLIENIANDPAKRSLAAALTGFARETGAGIVAEGVETEAELEMLKPLGVTWAQGYLLGRPMPLADAIEMLGRVPGRRAN